MVCSPAPIAAMDVKSAICPKIHAAALSRRKWSTGPEDSWKYAHHSEKEISTPAATTTMLSKFQFAPWEIVRAAAKVPTMHSPRAMIDMSE